MFRFENPLDPSKDGRNLFIDGIRYHIRDSLAKKEKIEDNLLRYVIAAKEQGVTSALVIYDKILFDLGYKDSDIIIADEHDIIEKINKMLNNKGI